MLENGNFKAPTWLLLDISACVANIFSGGLLTVWLRSVPHLWEAREVYVPRNPVGRVRLLSNSNSNATGTIYLYMHINSYFCLHLSSRVAESLWVPCSADLYLIRKSLVCAGVLLDQASADPGK